VTLHKRCNCSGFVAVSKCMFRCSNIECGYSTVSEAGTDDSKTCPKCGSAMEMISCSTAPDEKNVVFYGSERRAKT